MSTMGCFITTDQVVMSVSSSDNLKDSLIRKPSANVDLALPQLLKKALKNLPLRGFNILKI